MLIIFITTNDCYNVVYIICITIVVVIYKINVTEIMIYLQFVSLVCVRKIGMVCVVHKSALYVSVEERFLISKLQDEWRKTVLIISLNACLHLSYKYILSSTYLQ